MIYTYMNMNMEMEYTRDESEEIPSSSTWCPVGIIEKFDSASLEETLPHERSMGNNAYDMIPSDPDKVSQILWSTGMLAEPIPDGFYSLIPDKKLKHLFDKIPTLEELYGLELEGLRADVILVDAQKDKKLLMLKQLIATLVKGLNLNPAAIIKKIAGLVADYYKRSNVGSPTKATVEETCVQLLGHIKNGSCRPRALLFKVLADTVGFDSRLVVGLSNEGAANCGDSYKHMSIVVVLNSVELIVDLMRFPGQLIPRSKKAILMTHISGAGESDSAENDSCDSPLEPNSPLYSFSEESSEKDDNLHRMRRLESSSNMPEPTLRNKLLRSSSSIDGKLSVPDIAATFGRRSRRKVISESRTTGSSPEHPVFQACGRSMLSGDMRSDYPDNVGPSRSKGTSMLEHRRRPRRSLSITPEVGDDIVRAVRAMNETLKQNRLMRQVGSEFHNDGRSFHPSQEDLAASQKAMSLPTSPHDYRSPATSDYINTNETVSTWNKILDSPMFQNKPLLPYQEWNIDFSELTVGTRVGIGFFGEVFRGIWNGTDVAIKVFLEQDLTAENMEDFCNEVSILGRLRHPNVILFLGACIRPPRLSMVTEYMEMGSLYHLLHISGQKKKLSWRRRIKMIRDICRGLMCIHRMKMVHRDIKSANCLVNKYWTVKICDFGLSKMMNWPLKESESSSSSGGCGTPEWMAPELIRNEPFTEKCDIFSLGVIIWELCTLSRPWEGVPPDRVVYCVANEDSRLEIPEGPLGRLIADCWAVPDERPSCENILMRLRDCEQSLCVDR